MTRRVAPEPSTRFRRWVTESSADLNGFGVALSTCISTTIVGALAIVGGIHSSYVGTTITGVVSVLVALPLLVAGTVIRFRGIYVNSWQYQIVQDFRTLSPDLQRVALPALKVCLTTGPHSSRFEDHAQAIRDLVGEYRNTQDRDMTALNAIHAQINGMREIREIEKKLES